MKCTPKRIFSYLIIFFYQIGPVIDPKMRNLQEIMGFLLKNLLYLNLYALIKLCNTQNTPKCVENCSDDQLSYICSSTYYQFFCNLDYSSENSVFLVRYGTNSLVRPCA